MFICCWGKTQGTPLSKHTGCWTWPVDQLVPRPYFDMPLRSSYPLKDKCIATCQCSACIKWSINCHFCHKCWVSWSSVHVHWDFQFVVSDTAQIFSYIVCSWRRQCGKYLTLMQWLYNIILSSMEEINTSLFPNYRYCSSPLKMLYTQERLQPQWGFLDFMCSCTVVTNISNTQLMILKSWTNIKHKSVLRQGCQVYDEVPNQYLLFHVKVIIMAQHQNMFTLKRTQLWISQRGLNIRYWIILFSFCL